MRQSWDLRLGQGRQKIFEVRALYNDVTFIDEFLTPEFAIEQGFFSYDWSKRNDRFEIATREFKQVKERLLTQLTNMGNPFIFVEDGNFENRGELLLHHDHRGVDLRGDYSQDAMRALNRLWKRPVALRTVLESKRVLLRYDGQEFTTQDL
jgi:stage V sporulation protein R